MSELVIRIYYRLFYRPFMKFTHRHGWHRMKHMIPHPSHPEMPNGFLRCDWCGIHSDVPYSAKTGIKP